MWIQNAVLLIKSTSVTHAYTNRIPGSPIFRGCGKKTRFTFRTFSSEPAITIGDYGDDVPVRQFIAMDPPHHTPQRATVQPVVAPKQLSSLEPLIRQRVSVMLDELPLNEPFD